MRQCLRCGAVFDERMGHTCADLSGWPGGFRAGQTNSTVHLGDPNSVQVGGPAPSAPSPFPNSKRVAREFSVRGIQGRIGHIRELIKSSLLTPEVSRGIALGITNGCPRRNDACEIEALWHFAHGRRADGLPNVRYTGDINGYDTFQSALTTLQYGGGDCDDGMILFATLALGNQYPVKGRITANPGQEGWAHIYPLIGYPRNDPKTWVPFDWTLGYHYFGTAPPESKHVEFDGFQERFSPGAITPRDYKGW